jgi:alpha-L-fucosidase
MVMQPWFPAAKLGIFIHYGIYAVDGVRESWSFFDGSVPYEAYMKQLDGFTASRYDPRVWADLFARAGAGYAVLTAKHHDGVALWDAPHSDLTTVRRTPAERDLLTPYVDAMRERGLKVGIYFSHADWNHPDYATVDNEHEPRRPWNRFAYPPPGQHDPARWERFRTDYHAQVIDLVTRYRPDLMWFDGEWERSDAQWGARELGDALARLAPHAVINARLRTHADYATPEQAVPFTQPTGPWELCLTINDSWGYRGRDENWKTLRQIVRYFAETIGLGGNLLLDVGPREDGTIPQEAVERLEGLGRWVAKHAAAVHDTVAGLPPGHFYGPTTLAADRRTIHLICVDDPREHLALRGLANRVKRVTVLGSGRELSFRKDEGLDQIPGHTWIEAPAAADIDPAATVLSVELDGELALYDGAGRT